MLDWFNNLKMQTRLLLLYSAITLLGTISTGWYIYTVIQYDREVERIVQEAKEIAEVEGVQVYLQEEQIAILDYRLADFSTEEGVAAAEEFLVTYAQSEADADLFLQRALVDAGSAAERNMLEELSNEKETFNRGFDEVIALHDEGDIEGSLEKAAEIDAVEQERLRRMHDQVERFVYTGELTLDEAVHEADRRAKNAILFGVVVLLLFSGLTVAASLVTNQVSEPVLHMTNAVVAFENNAFEPRLLESYVKRREEMGQLARAFTRMVESITTTAQSRDDLLAAASRFVPVAYLEFLEKNTITDIRLGDHVSAEMAVMFSDIRSFTTISEGMTPQENFDFVNDYLKQVSPTIQYHNGFVVKFLGDGMMAIFPYDVEDALKAGIAKMEVVHRFNAARTQRGELPIDLGIGIHTGHMMVGMIGEEGRMQGDAFSDNVNLTARIEGLNKFFGTSLIISAETLARLEEPGKYDMRQLGQVIVKGREKPITLYEVFDGDPAERRATKRSTLQTFTEALERYRMGALEEAKPLFEQVVAANPDDRTAAMYLAEIAEYEERGKPEYWDGVIVMTSK